MTSLAKTALVLATIFPTACVMAVSQKEHTGKAYALHDLKRMHADLKKVYYDPEMRGQDMDAHLKVAQDAIERSTSDQQRFQALSKFLLTLDDSHTYYAGPTPIGLSDFGFSFRFHGDAAFVSAVDAWSVADSMGVRRGDEILGFAGQQLTRDNAYRVLIDFLGRHPIESLQLELRAPDRSISHLKVTADTIALAKLGGRDFRKLYSLALDSVRRASGHMTTSILKNRVLVWKLPEFENADLRLGKVMDVAAEHEVLVLDTRGNRGGPIARLEKLLGYFIEEPVEVGTLRMRWESKSYKAKPRRGRFRGKMFILVDSETASSAEVFARLLQLQQRATIVGDRTSGSVMASMGFGYASITVSDFLLFNGERLEKHGVVPDITVIPTAQQIAAGHDPALAHVLNLIGIRTTAAQAATVNPFK